MGIIKSLAVVGYALVMLLVLTGGRSANEAEFNAVYPVSAMWTN